MPSLAPTLPTSPPGPPVKFMHRVEYVASRLAVGALRLLGWRAGGALGGLLAQLAYKPIGIRRGVVERQIAAAFPEFDQTRIERVARRAYDSLGRTSIEAAILGGTPTSEVKARFARVDGWEQFEEARARGRGVIIVTGHIGNWELGAAYVTAQGIPLGAVARKMANPLFDAWLTRTRARNGMDVIYDGDAVRRAPRVLRDGGVVAFLCDQDALGLASTFVPFFGRPAKTPRGPAVFALRLDVPVFFAAAVRMPDGRYHRCTSNRCRSSTAATGKPMWTPWCWRIRFAWKPSFAGIRSSTSGITAVGADSPRARPSICASRRCHHVER
jgi:KDO2-lipid IV(A) lauroyltransferase